MGTGKADSLGGPASLVPACHPTHRKVYLATLLFSSTVRSARSPGWRMETRTLLTVECLSRWRAHCTVMALAVTFMISKPSTGRGPGRSKWRGLRSASGHHTSFCPFPTPQQGVSCLPLWIGFPSGSSSAPPALPDSCSPILTTCGQVGGTSICLPARPHAIHSTPGPVLLWPQPPPRPISSKGVAVPGPKLTACPMSALAHRGHPEPGSRCPQHLALAQGLPTCHGQGHRPLLCPVPHLPSPPLGFTWSQPTGEGMWSMGFPATIPLSLEGSFSRSNPLYPQFALEFYIHLR